MLDFLRGVQLELPTSKRELRGLWREADFYGLDGLKHLIPLDAFEPDLQPNFDFESYGSRVLEGHKEVVAALDNLFSKLPKNSSWIAVVANPQRERLLHQNTSRSRPILRYAMSEIIGSAVPAFCTERIRLELRPDGHTTSSNIQVQLSEQVSWRMVLSSYLYCM